MAPRRTRPPEEALAKGVGKISTARRPRHLDNALVAISYIHRIEHIGQFHFFPVRRVFETIQELHALRNDDIPLGKYMESSIRGHVLKALAKAGYLEFSDFKTKIQVIEAASNLMHEIAENVEEMSLDSLTSKHRAHCDYYRQKVGPLGRVTYKDLAIENESLEDKVEEYENHKKTCTDFAQPKPFQRATSVETEVSSTAFDAPFQIHTPDNSMDPDENDQPNDLRAGIRYESEAAMSNYPNTPAAALRKPVHSTPANPYMTPDTMPRMRPQRTITQATITPPPSPFGNRRSLSPPSFEDADDDSMIVDSFPDSGSTQELETVRKENIALKTWTNQMADLVRPYWGQKVFDANDTEEISTSTTRIIANLQFAEADIVEKDERLDAVQVELNWTRANSEAQIESLSLAVKNAEQDLLAFQQENGADRIKLNELIEELETTKTLLSEAIKEKDAAVAQIKSMFMGAGRFLGFNIEDRPTSISAGPILRR